MSFAKEVFRPQLSSWYSLESLEVVVPFSVPEVEPDSVPDVVPEVVPFSVPEVVPEVVPFSVPEVSPSLVPLPLLLLMPLTFWESLAVSFLALVK